MTVEVERFEWLSRWDGVLCLSGYPIQIRVGTDYGRAPYTLVVEGRPPLAYWRVDAAMHDGERKADEMRLMFGY